MVTVITKERPWSRLTETSIDCREETGSEQPSPTLKVQPDLVAHNTWSPALILAEKNPQMWDCGVFCTCGKSLFCSFFCSLLCKNIYNLYHFDYLQLTKKQSSLQGRRRKWNKEQTKVIIRLIDVFCREKKPNGYSECSSAAVQSSLNSVELCSEDEQSQCTLKDLGVEAFHTAVWLTLSVTGNELNSLSLFFFYPPVAPGLCVRGRSEQSLYSYSLFFVRLLISLPLFRQWRYTNIHLHS